MTRIRTRFFQAQKRGGGGRRLLPLGLCALLLVSGMALWAQSEAVVVTSATDSEIVVATLTPAEGGGFTLDGEPFAGGAVTLDSGATYLLAMAEDGAWTATFQPAAMTVPLGDSKLSVEIASAEDGTWWIGETAVASGDTHMAGTNASGRANRYRLTLQDGEWSARYLPDSIAVAGTDLVATPHEDGSGYAIGTAMLGIDGIGDVTVDGAMYHVHREAGGGLVGARFAQDMATRPDYKDVVGRSGRPRLSPDDRATAANEAATALEAVSVQFPVGDLLGSGRATVEGDNIVAAARAEIAKLRGQVVQLVALHKDDGIDAATFADQLYDPDGDGDTATGKWPQAEAQIKKIFGSAHGDLEEVLHEDRVVDAFDELVAALSSVEAFTAATDADGPDFIAGFRGRTAAQAAAAFGRTASTAAAALSVLGDVRYGAATFNETAVATDGLGPAELAQAFAYSTIPAVRRSSDVQVAGSAFYSGGTHAVDAEGNLYAGDIDVEVRFSELEVGALVSGLTDVATGDPWRHGFGGAVAHVWLPDVPLSRAGTWNGWSGDARLGYELRPGGSLDEVLSGQAEFSGRLLGRGEDAGEQAVGVWRLNDPDNDPMLAGSFGVQRGPDRLRPTQKLADDLLKVSAVMTLDSLDADDAQTNEDNPTEDPVNRITQALGSGNNNLKLTFEGGVEYTLNRGTLLDGGFAPTSLDATAQAARHESRKDTHREGVREEFGKAARQLASVVALDTDDAGSLRPTLRAQRQRLFDALQSELEKLFGADVPAPIADPANPPDPPLAPLWVNPGVLQTTATPDPAPAWATDAAGWNGAHEDYPVNGAGVPQDGQLAGRIADVQAALADRDAFLAAFGEDGVFDAYDNADTQRPDAAGGFVGASAMWDLPASRLLLWTERTDFTRFGAWSLQASADGSAALAERATDPQFGVFAYSPLAQTEKYASAEAVGYPGRELPNAQAGKVLATYLGRTAATGGGIFYEGDVEVLVEWDTATVSGNLALTISDLVPTDPRYAALRVGQPDVMDEGTGEFTPRLGTYDVRALKFTTAIAETDGKLGFSVEALPEITIGGSRLAEPPLAEGSVDKRWAQALPVTYDETAEVGMEAIADQVARFRPGRLNALPNPWTGEDGIQSTVFHVITQKGQMWLWNRNNVPGSSGLGTGGFLAPANGFNSAISTDYDDIEMPTYIRNYPVPGGVQARHWDFRFADGSIARWWNQQAANPWNRIDGLIARAADPDVPNADDPHSGSGLTAATMSVMLKSWFFRTGSINLFEGDLENAQLDGQFVGQGADGPTGMIGTWELPAGVYGVGDVREAIQGSFGAEYAP